MLAVLKLFLTISRSKTSGQANSYKGFLKHSINILTDLIFLCYSYFY